MKLVPIKLSQTVARQLLTAKKNSPHIFFAAGTVGVIGSTILACKATLKLEDTVDEIQKDFTDLRINGTVDAAAKTRVYISSGKKLGRLYGPSVLLGAASVAALTGSHVQMARRNAALTATLAAVTKAFDEYRIRVREEVGEERENELHRNIKEVKDEDGKKIKAIDPTNSIYSFIFDKTTSKEWHENMEYNRIFIECQERMANHKLTVNGHVLLNDVLDALGMPRTTPGCVVGWVLDKNGESPRGGDGYISFGAFEGRNYRMINERPSFFLEFNCDGNVHDLIEKM
jgi:hypothetical protein